jgi:hypothetical protein
MQNNIRFWHTYVAQFFLEWKMFQTKVAENIKTRILSSVTFFLKSSFFEIMSKIIVEPDRPRMTIWRMQIACWVPRATNTLIICNTYDFTSVRMLTPSYLDVKLYVHCEIVKFYSAFGKSLCI